MAKPIRDVLKALHDKRSAGYKSQRSAKGAPPRGNDDVWPSFWTTAAEESFLAVKDAVANAVDLAIPDYAGAASGVNPFVLVIDACSYGVGAGLFQAAPDEVLQQSHYQALGVPTWSTKQDIIKAYNKKKKALRVSQYHDQAMVDKVEEAFKALEDVSVRKRYDEEMNAKRTARTLRPLGFMSKSLTKAQMNWTVWEKELLGGVEGTLHFESIVRGFPTRILTDHLNSTLMPVELKQPDKVLRMILKIESTVIALWTFLPGRGNPVADGMSRNPPEREASRCMYEEKSFAPDTLGAAFDMAKDSLGSTDDADWVINASQTVDYSAQEVRELWTQPQFQPRVRVQVVGTSKVPTMFLPSFKLEEGNQDYSKYQIKGRKLDFEMVNVLEPTVQEVLGSARWLEQYEAPPMNKKTKRRLRLTILDGLLSLLRGARDDGVISVVSHGEGCIVHMAVFSPEARLAAYSERAVTDSERGGLEEIAKGQEFAIFMAPLTMPKAFFALIKEALPELNVINIETTNAMVLVPLKDGNADLCRQIGSTIHGATMVNVTFPGPAYKSVPQELFLDGLNRDQPELPSEMPPRRCREMMCGSAHLTAEWTRYAFECRAYERRVPAADGSSYQPEGDLALPSVLTQVVKETIEKTVYHDHFSPSCGTFSIMQNANKNRTRTPEMPQGSGANPDEVEGNLGIVLCIFLISCCMVYGVFFAIEHPINSYMWKLPFFKWLIALSALNVGIYVVEFDACAYGARPPGYKLSDGDVRNKKGYRLITSNPWLAGLQLKCAEVAPHHHEAIEGSKEGGKYTELTSPYCHGLCARYGQLLKAGYDRGAVAPRFDFQRPKLTEIDILWKPEKDAGEVQQRPLQVEEEEELTGGSSSSAAVPPERQAPILPEEVEGAVGSAAPAKDYWIETGTSLLRYHVTPRRAMFYPGSVAEATDDQDRSQFPELMDLKPVRHTFFVFGGAAAGKVIKDTWTEAATAARPLQKEWTGRSIFQKLKPTAAAVEDRGEVPVDGQPIRPVVAGMSVLRKELAEGQRQDPELNDIIKYLEKQPLGSITHAKHLKSALVKRAEHFKLASDGVLVAKLEDDLHDRPVVPNVAYAGESSLPEKPKNMTWKHLLLAMVHQTPTGPHLRATEMVAELQETVMWNLQSG